MHKQPRFWVRVIDELKCNCPGGRRRRVHLEKATDKNTIEMDVPKTEATKMNLTKVLGAYLL